MARVLGVVLLGLFVLGCQAVVFTGDANADFKLNLSPSDFLVTTVPDPSGAPDVGVPAQVDQGNQIVSGWDVNVIYFQYNPDKDELYIGVDCYVICGDADGLLGPDTTSPQLASIGGEDTADLSGSESFAISIDWDKDGRADHIIGVPGGNPTIGPVLACAGSGFSMASCFGLYQHLGMGGQVAPAFQFAVKTAFPTVNNNPSPSAVRPDLEWTVGKIRDVRASLNIPFGASPYEPWTFRINAFAGSFVDSGIGEDYVPDQFNFVTVSLPCGKFDRCDVCLGDDSSCLDCLRVPNGPNKYDACDVCGGNGKSCADCAGVPNGPSKYDVCDVCAGNGKSCLDCKGMANGPNKYDVCDVCGGDGMSCLDCAGVPNGAGKYDVCDVCNGDGSACVKDCAGVEARNGGDATYDVCDVCGGDGLSCVDCLMVPNGPNKYDVCDVCAGNGKSCADCAGVPNGPNEYDACDVCGGDGYSCIDCAGIPFGRTKYDLCGVCGGDGMSCRDCRGVPFGPNTYDECGLCRSREKPCYYNGYNAECHEYGHTDMAHLRSIKLHHHDDDDDDSQRHNFGGARSHHGPRHYDEKVGDYDYYGSYDAIVPKSRTSDPRAYRPVHNKDSHNHRHQENEDHDRMTRAYSTGPRQVEYVSVDGGYVSAQPVHGSKHGEGLNHNYGRFGYGNW